MGKKVLYDGKEIELDDEIVNEIGSDAVKKHQEDNPDKTSEWEEKVKEAQTERDELKTKIEELESEEEEEEGEEETDDTAKNISGLRKKLEEKDKAMKDMQGKIDITDKFVTSSIQEKAIDKYAGDDEEMAKKINFHLTETLTAVKPTTEKELKAKVEQAARLSGWAESKKDALNEAARTTGDTTPKSSEIDRETSEIGDKLGITKEDLKKHGKQ